MKKRDTFIVIEGTDGSGKATQTKLLAKALRRAGRMVKTIAFPQYGKPSAAPVEAYLRGEYGPLNELGPYRTSILYGIDRLTAQPTIGRWLKAGYAVIADRYIASNLAHQGAKITSRRARQRYWRWCTAFEFGLLDIPRPDGTIILFVPPEVSQRLILKKQQRGYLGKRKRDIHERDLRYQRRVARAYLELARHQRGTKIINCAPRGQLLSITEVHQLVMRVVNKFLK